LSTPARKGERHASPRARAASRRTSVPTRARPDPAHRATTPSARASGLAGRQQRRGQPPPPRRWRRRPRRAAARPAGARTAADAVVGAEEKGTGWRVARRTAGFAPK
jgi:hypothetical protein